MPQASEAELTVDLDALAANYRLLCALGGPAEVAPVVKADGYGLGAAALATRLWAEGARRFFVARVAEGLALRRALGPDRPATVHVLDGCPPGAAAAMVQAGLVPVLNSLVQIEEWGAAARAARRRLEAAVHVDTGMNRLGLRPEEAHALADAPDRLAGLDLDLLVSHLACGDEPDQPQNAVQATRFAEIAGRFPSVRRSLAASGGMFQGPAYHLDVVRPGIALYGGGPFNRPDSRLSPVATLRAPILQVRNVSPGETVGYGAAFTAAEPMRVAVVAAGYADGALRAASPGGYGWLEGARCGFLGRISMDLIALDVTHCRALDAQPGAWVELLGSNVLLDDAARAAGSIAHEVLCRIGARAGRRYLGDAG